LQVTPHHDVVAAISRRNGIVLDPFGGSGTTILAAERTSRIARTIELDPLYVDVTVRRRQHITGIPARHFESQMGFADLGARRGAASAIGGARRGRNPVRSMGG